MFGHCLRVFKGSLRVAFQPSTLALLGIFRLLTPAPQATAPP